MTRTLMDQLLAIAGGKIPGGWLATGIWEVGTFGLDALSIQGDHWLETASNDELIENTRDAIERLVISSGPGVRGLNEVKATIDGICGSRAKSLEAGGSA